MAHLLVNVNLFLLVEGGWWCAWESKTDGQDSFFELNQIYYKRQIAANGYGQDEDERLFSSFSISASFLYFLSLIMTNKVGFTLKYANTRNSTNIYTYIQH